MKSARRRSRELALQALYAWQLGGGTYNELAAHAAESGEFAKADEALFRSLVSGTLQQADTLRASIEPQLDRAWTELSPVERGILLMAAYELTFSAEVPFRVVINEAVEIAKSFGGTDGYKYVNGVLDRLGKALRPHEALR
jgi:transcription antitermination protein NusB